MQKEGGTAWGRRSLESRQERRNVEREIQNYRDDSEQLGSSTGREWRAGESERARKKTELLHRANVCARLEITRTRGALHSSLSRQKGLVRPLPSRRH